jgi:hypothetical protein
MYNGTCCALKSHAKSRFSRDAVRRKNASCLAESHNRDWVRGSCGCSRGFLAPPSRIFVFISAARDFTAGRTR